MRRTPKRLEVIAASAISVCCLALAIAQGGGIFPSSPSGPVAALAANEARPRVEVVFVIDTTGSMGGLLDGAKQKVWAIANRLASGQPRPDVDVGLVAYRDHGDSYVTKRLALTGDMDTVYDELLAYEADGGGDTPEHLAAGLNDAIEGMQWSDDPNVLKVVFVVGDAPAHEGIDNLDARTLARTAAERGIVVNTIQCGSDPVAASAFRDLALAGGGQYAAIEQDGGVVTIATPFDEDLARLDRKLASTMLGYGDGEARDRAARKLDNRLSMAPSRAAEAAAYSAKSGRMNDEDLLWAVENGLRLDSVQAEDLPDTLAGLQGAALEQRLAEIRTERERITKSIRELADKRESWLADQERGADGFDAQVVEIIRTQAADKGIDYGS